MWSRGLILAVLFRLQMASGLVVSMATRRKLAVLVVLLTSRSEPVSMGLQTGQFPAETEGTAAVD